MPSLDLNRPIMDSGDSKFFICNAELDRNYRKQW